MLRRLIPHPYLSLSLFVTWTFLMNSFSPGTLVVALVIATVVPLATAAYWPDRAQVQHPFRLAAYVALVLWDVVMANLQVARIILFVPADKIRSAWISVPVDLASPEALTVLAGTITMTPGTVTAEFSADRKALLIHVLHAPDPDAVRDEIKTRYEARLKRIFA